MLAWLDFFNILFWLLLFVIFIFNTNFLSLLLLSEFMWILLYVFVLVLAGYADDLLLSSLAFYFLGLAGVEFSFGFLLIIFFKSQGQNVDFSTNLANSNSFLTVSNSNKAFLYGSGKYQF